MRVRHNAEELNDGETVILTMADRNILDERGNLAEDGDELENALMVCALCVHSFTDLKQYSPT